jgi:hypothetical protein
MVYPVRVRCDAAGDCAFQLRGGAGYVPTTLTGVKDYRRCVLEREVGAGGVRRWQRIDQSVRGNDYWQAEYRPARASWNLSFNVPADELAVTGQPLTLRLAPLP